MPCVILNKILFTMVHILIHLEYNNDYIIAISQISLLFISLQVINKGFGG